MTHLMAVYGLLANWGFSEMLVFRADRQAGNGTRTDRYSRLLIVVAMTLAISIGMACLSTGWGRLPGPWQAWWMAGSVMVAAGIVLRARAVKHLGRHFRTHVTIMDDHQLIDDGPYSRVRHPSYTAMLLSCAGLGTAMGNVPAVVALMVLPLVALANRIRVEERALANAFGPDWTAYRSRTAALIPGLW